MLHHACSMQIKKQKLLSTTFRWWNFGKENVPGNAPPSLVRPQPTAIPVLPDGSASSAGKHTGIMFFVNVTGFRSFSNAISWLYVLPSKFLCFIIALTARILASESVVIVWSWSPKITRIFERFSLWEMKRDGWIDSCVLWNWETVGPNSLTAEHNGPQSERNL